MKFLLLLPSIWLLCISLFSLPNHARLLPFFPPISAPALAPESLPISSAPALAPESLPISSAPATFTAAPLANQCTQQRKEEQNRRLVRALSLAIIAVSTVAGLIVLATFCVFVCAWKNLQKSNLRSIQSSDAAMGLALSGNFKTNSKKGSVSMLEYSAIEAATDGFSETNILGEGGFGLVYKACFDGRFLAAVKRLEGRDFEKQFQNEVDLMNQIQHPNIVSLLGNCIHSQTRLLVYEFMPNGSLETQLHEQSHGSALSWHIRMKIALDVARGLEYLHEHCNPPVIHRDLKSSNILLDSSFNAKISDFGLAITIDKNRGNIKLSGTLGYVAPEYLLDGKLTEKSDVYAFGIILLELLTGRRPVEKMTPSHCQSITTWAIPQLNDRSKLPNIVDPTIRNTMDLKHLHQVAAVAVLCVQQEPSYRPLITDVLHSLIPLVPVELGGALKAMEYPTQTVPNSAE